MLKKGGACQSASDGQVVTSYGRDWRARRADKRRDRQSLAAEPDPVRTTLAKKTQTPTYTGILDITFDYAAHHRKMVRHYAEDTGSQSMQDHLAELIGAAASSLALPSACIVDIDRRFRGYATERKLVALALAEMTDATHAEIDLAFGDRRHTRHGWSAGNAHKTRRLIREQPWLRTQWQSVRSAIQAAA